MTNLSFALPTVKFVLIMLSIFHFVAATENPAQPTSREFNVSAYTLLQKGHYKLAYKKSQLALNIARKAHNSIEEARALSNLGSNLYYLGDLDRALFLYLKSLNIALNNGDIKGELRAINNIAGLYFELENPQEALAYQLRHLSVSQQLDDPHEVLTSYTGLTYAYVNNDRLQDAKDSNLLSKRLLESNDFPFLKAYVLFAENAIFKVEKKFDLALENALLIRKIAQQNKYDGIEVSALAEIARYYNMLGKFDHSIEAALQALKLAEKLELKKILAEIHEILSEVYSKQREFEKSLFHSKTAYDIKSETINQKVKTLGEITKIEREVTKTEKQLLQSQKDGEILALKLEKQKQDLFVWIFSFFSIFLMILFLYYRRVSEKELLRQKQLNLQLKELDVVKDRVLTNTSHELRTPLNGIIGLSNMIIHDEESELTESTMQSLKLIERSGQQLALVINDILELSKLKNDKVTVANTQFDLVDLINDVIEVCSSSAAKTQLDVIFEHKNQYIEVNQDQVRVQQIIFNVIGNAIKFTPQGEVKITLNKCDKEFSVNVTDTGIGIPEDKIERIFEGFEQVDSSDSREYSGTGLGLTISKKLAEVLGGKIVLTSELGKGTQVEIKLPC